MPTRDMIVIGSSAGGVEALKSLVGDLSGDLEATLLVVFHVPSHNTSFLPQILRRNGPLQATHPDDGEKIRRGHICIAPPNRHWVLRDGKIHVSSAPKENGFRPAIDPLFRSAAKTYNSRVIGVILSGVLGYGSFGLKSIKQAGGITIVQDLQEAVFAEMPGRLRPAGRGHRLNYQAASRTTGAKTKRCPDGGRCRKRARGCQKRY